MEETNFYAYMYAHAATFAFDELAEVVDLTEPKSVQRAFEAYLKEYSNQGEHSDEATMKLDEIKARIAAEEKARQDSIALAEKEQKVEQEKPVETKKPAETRKQ